MRLCCPWSGSKAVAAVNRRVFSSSTDLAGSEAVNNRTSDDLENLKEKDFSPRKALLVRKVTRYEYEKVYLKPECDEQQLKDYVSVTNLLITSLYNYSLVC